MYTAQHWKNKLHTLNSVDSIITLAIPSLYTKHYSFLNVPETWEAKSEAGIFLTISNRSSWIDSAVWIRQSDAEELKKKKKPLCYLHLKQILKGKRD